MNFLIQMHGEPGSGKTTLARALAPRIPAIHLDKDVVMTAIMKTRIPRDVAGPASYETIWDLSRSLIEQGNSVIVDSPAYWPVIEQKGRGIARVTGAGYFMIETRCTDTGEIERRLLNRERLPTNPQERQDWLAVPGTSEPARERLILDSQRPLDELVNEALAYLGKSVAA
jgi:predicted kinase